MEIIENVLNDKIKDFTNLSFFIRYDSKEVLSNGLLYLYTLYYDSQSLKTNLTSSMFLFLPSGYNKAFAFPTRHLFNIFHLKYTKIHTSSFWDSRFSDIYDYSSVLKNSLYELFTRIRLSQQSSLV